MGKTKTNISSYKKIAINIAHAIGDGEYKVGDRIFSKTTLASKYGVSDETARRAVIVLSDAGVVDIKKNSGVIIKSEEKALQFIQEMGELNNTLDITATLTGQMKENIDNIHTMQKTLDELVGRISYYSRLTSIVPKDILITKNCPFIGSSISAIQFWQNTGATVVALQHKGVTCISPGPECKLTLGDTIFYVGEVFTKKKVEDFLYGTKKEE
jgi:K+/H+ antiporter YhaU regulatory subunit KhtT